MSRFWFSAQPAKPHAANANAGRRHRRDHTPNAISRIVDAPTYPPGPRAKRVPHHTLVPCSVRGESRMALAFVNPPSCPVSAPSCRYPCPMDVRGSSISRG